MAIAVICPHCFKRFQVSERFAGMKGPCPSCRGTIDIPKANVTVHAPDEVVESGKVGKKRVEAHPIRRLDLDFSVRDGIWGLVMVAAVAVVTWILGLLIPSSWVAVKYVVAVAAMLALCGPISAFGYLIMRDQDALFVWTGQDLYKRAWRLGGAYTLFWIVYELALRYTGANYDPVFTWVVLVPFAVLAAIVAMTFFDFDFTRGLLHASIAFVAFIFLRGIFGLGWLWIVAPKMTGGNVPTPWG
ncbi:MAG: hypothetical protein ACRC46_02550 [Thermoguttaceae bacterium]